jgi:hypothetical protein
VPLYAYEKTLEVKFDTTARIFKFDSLKGRSRCKSMFMEILAEIGKDLFEFQRAVTEFAPVPIHNTRNQFAE